MMTILLFGCLGGIVNSLLGGGFELPKKDSEANIWKPGWIGNVVVGGVAALAFWAFYGPLTQMALIGSGPQDAKAVLTVGEVMTSLLAGTGGGKILNDMIDKRIMTREADALTTTKEKLASVLSKMIEASELEDEE